MTYLTAILLGVALLVTVDICGAFLSRFLKFHYAYLALLSLAVTLSPLYLTDEQTSPSQAAVLSLIIYAPETFLGLFIAYKINPYTGRSDYRETISEAGFVASYVTCLITWVAVAGGVYLLK